MTRTSIFRTAAILGTACLLAGNAMAAVGEAYPQEPAPFQSTRTRAEVQAEARNPVRIHEGSTGVMSVQSQTTRDAVRQQASIATRNGTALYGEMGHKL